MLLSEILLKVSSMFPSSIALKQGNQILSYGELYDKAARLAGAFRQLGINPGERIALLGNPCLNLAVAEYAAVAMGAIPFAIFPSLTPNEIQYIINDAEPVAIIYDTENASIAKKCSSYRQLVHISCSPNSTDISIDKLVTQTIPMTNWYKADPSDVAVIIYTGGTTGRPKGVMHSHHSITNWFNINPPHGLGFSPNQRPIAFNLAHLSGQSSLWMTLAAGGCLLFLETYPAIADEVVTIIEREHVTNLGTVGGLLRDILHLPNIDHRDLSSVKVITCGGYMISVNTLLRASETFPSASIINLYSQTESGNVVSLLPVNHIKAGPHPERLLSVGSPAIMGHFGQKVFEIRIVDDSGNDLPQGQLGEVVLKGEQVMLRYWNNPEMTQQVLRDGWLYTGDIGRLDEEGYLYLVDRKIDMIIVNGLNVYCSEVEEVIAKHPSIQDVAVIGTPLDEEGEEVTAVVTLRPSKDINIEDIQQFCTNQIASFKVPTHLRIIDSLPRTSVDKVNKTIIREMFSAGPSRRMNS